MTTFDDQYDKDPSAVLDYKWDWAAWLAAGETITAKTIATTDTRGAVSTVVTVDSSTIAGDSKSVTAWISGGTAGATVDVICHITTSAARQDDRRIRLKIINR